MTSPWILLNTYHLRAKKGLGQNFLADPSIPETIIIRSGVSNRDRALEIGAGLGALTLPLARCVKAVYAVEKDPDIANILERQLRDERIDNVDVIVGDILKLDIQTLYEKEGQPLMVFGNLPYNISSQVLVQLIHARKGVDSAVLMFQKEMAKRLLARPGSRDYSRLTVLLRYCADARSMVHIKADAFYPKPKIDSEVLQIRFNKDYGLSLAEEKYLFRVVRAAFGRRRKTIKNALSKSELGIDAGSILEALNQAGIDPMRRAETLRVSEYIHLSASIRTVADWCENEDL